MLRYKTLSLDVDNTLINTDDVYPAALHFVYLGYFKKLTDLVRFEEFKEVYKKVRQLNHGNLKATGASHSRTLYFKYLLQHFGLDYDMELLLKMQQAYWTYVLKHARLYPGVVELLKKAKNAFVRIAVVTDNRLEVQLQKLGFFGLDKYVDVVISSEEAGADKPSQAMFLFALSEVNARKSDALVVGNNAFTDILGGNLAGIDTCQFIPGTLDSQKSDAIKPKYAIKDFSQLQEIMLLKDRQFSEQQAVVIDLVGGLVLPNHPIRDILLSILRKQGIQTTYDKLVNLYYQLIYGEISHQAFWDMLGVRNFSTVLRTFFSKMRVSLRTLNILKQAFAVENTKVIIATNLYSQWWKYLQDVQEFAKLVDYVSFPDTVGFKKEDTDYWYQIFYRFPRIPAQNYTFYDSNLTVLKTLKHFWGKKVWLKSEEQKFIFIPDEIVEV